MSLFLPLALAAAAGPSPAAGPTDPTADLIRRLGSPAWADREEATRALDAVGPPALDSLRRAARSGPNPEAVWRAAVLAARIAARVESAAALAPTTVELNCTNMPADKACLLLEKQTGYRLQVPAAGLPRCTLHTGRVSFWEAVDRLGRAAGLEPEAVTSGVGVAGGVPGQAPVSPPTPGAIVLRGRGRPAAALAPAGAAAVLLAPRPEAARAVVPAGRHPLLLTVVVEPKLTWVGPTVVRVTKATDAAGRRLEADAAANARMPGRGLVTVGADGRPVAGGLFPLQPNQAVVPLRPADGGDTPTAGEPVAVEGVVLGQVRGPGEEVAAVDLGGLTVGQSATARGRKGTEVQATVMPPTAGNRYNLNVNLNYDPDFVQPYMDPASFVPALVFLNRRVRPAQLTPNGNSVYGLTVTDADGRPLTVAPTVDPNFRGPGFMAPPLSGQLCTVRLTLAVAAGGSAKPPVRLVFRGSRTTPVEVPFAFTDLPTGR